MITSNRTVIIASGARAPLLRETFRRRSPERQNLRNGLRWVPRKASCAGLSLKFPSRSSPNCSATATESPKSMPQQRRTVVKVSGDGPPTAHSLPDGNSVALCFAAPSCTARVLRESREHPEERYATAPPPNRASVRKAWGASPRDPTDAVRSSVLAGLVRSVPASRHFPAFRPVSQPLRSGEHGLNDDDRR